MDFCVLNRIVHRYCNWPLAVVAVLLYSGTASAELRAAPWVGSVTVDRVVAASSPDNAHDAILQSVNQARRSIHTSVYVFDNPFLADAYAAALDRGVSVVLALEGRPIPKLTNAALYVAHRLVSKGAKVYFYDTPERKDRTFKYLHAKYTIIDGYRVIVGSANYGKTGHPIDPTFGNREWEVVLDGRDIAALFDQAFRHDLGLRDQWVAYGSTERYQFDPASGYKEDRSKVRLDYKPRLQRAVDTNAPVETVFAPENSLEMRVVKGKKTYNGPMFRQIAAAERTVYVEQLNIEAYWGGKKYNPEPEANPLVQSLLAAARSGRTVRVILNDDTAFMDKAWPPKDAYYGTLLESLTNMVRLASASFRGSLEDSDTDALEDDAMPRDSSSRKNDVTLDHLNRIAREQGLDLQARLLDYRRCSFAKLHNKGMIVDGKVTLAGSLNWGESALKFNREAGVLIHSPAVARYYTENFAYDWKCSESKARRRAEIMGW